MKIALAYPWTDADGVEHAPDEVLEAPADLPLRKAKLLVRDGLARAVSETAPAEPADGGVALFDPSRNTVNSVLTHLASADDAERVRVLDAERAGKARDGVLTAQLPDL